MRVLVVEDEVKMADLLRRGLIHEGRPADVDGAGTDASWAVGELEAQHRVRARAARAVAPTAAPAWARMLPMFTLVFVLVVPAAVTLHYLAADLVRVGQQYAIDRISA